MSSPLYRSQTRTVPTVIDVPTALRNALTTHADTKKLALAGTRIWVTHRENPIATGMFGKLFSRRSNTADPDAEHDMVLVLHATHVIVGTSGAARGTTVISLPLVQATVTRGSILAGRLQGAPSDLPSDDGLTISGFPGDQGRPGTYFVGLGPGADAEACAQAVIAAAEAAKNPAT
jgi:hypothetical protein